MQGATKIIGVDINEKKAQIGEVFGMTDFINPQNHPNKLVSDLVKDMTNGLGVDYSFECTGVAPLLNEALEASKIVHKIQPLFIYFAYFFIIFENIHIKDESLYNMSGNRYNSSYWSWAGDKLGH